MANVTHIYGNEVTDAAARGSLAPAYSASSTYSVGDLVLHDGQLYECNTTISTAEAWTAAHWTAKTVADEVSSLKGGLTEKYTKPSGGIPSTDMTSEVQTSLGKADSAYQKPSGGIPSTDLASGVIPSVPVTDVQVNGSSVLSNGVANVPVTSENTAGVAKINPVYGIHLRDAPNNDQLMIYKADSPLIKAGSNQHRPIVPQKQHESVFYGLTKAAGADMASSSNAVGVYTDAAKVAIQKMLGIYEPPYELIREITLTERTSLDITVDDNGLPFELLGVFVEVLYAENLTSESSGYGRYHFYDSDTKYVYAETGRYNTNSQKQFKDIFVNRKSNLAQCSCSRLQPASNFSTIYLKSAYYNGTFVGLKNITRIAMNSQDYEPAGTNIKIYGQRAY